jgi:hypothetical protein
VVGTYGNIIDHHGTDHYLTGGTKKGRIVKSGPEKATETRLRT